MCVLGAADVMGPFMLRALGDAGSCIQYIEYSADPTDTGLGFRPCNPGVARQKFKFVRMSTGSDLARLAPGGWSLR